MVLHGWRGRRLSADDDLRSHLCFKVKPLQMVAGRSRCACGYDVYCQLFLIVFFPVVVGCYHFAARQIGREPSQPWKPFAWGFAAVTVIFGAFNMAVNGRFLFFINSLGTAAKLVVNHNPYVDSTYGWLSGATWLVLPTIAFVGAVLCLSRNKALNPSPT